MKRLINHDNYHSYVVHQSKKTKCKELRQDLIKNFDNKVKLFEIMLTKVKKLRPNGGKVLCLGSRIGEEVQAFINLGFDAIGIDLVPNPPLVIEGDFNKLKEIYPKESFDIIYTNAIDHIWEKTEFFNGCIHIMKPKALFVLHLCLGMAREYETYFIKEPQEVINSLSSLKLLTSEEGFIKDLGGHIIVGGISHELILEKN